MYITCDSTVGARTKHLGLTQALLVSTFVCMFSLVQFPYILRHRSRLSQNIRRKSRVFGLLALHWVYDIHIDTEDSNTPGTRTHARRTR